MSGTKPPLLPEKFMSCTETTTFLLSLPLQFCIDFSCKKEIERERDSNPVRKSSQEIQAVKNNELN
jgi:hypothetical protein